MNMIDRASTPRVGDSFTKLDRAIRIARIDNRHVHLEHLKDGVFVVEKPVPVDEYARIAANTISNGALFTPIQP